jgi:imidazolonepropionase
MLKKSSNHGCEAGLMSDLILYHIKTLYTPVGSRLLKGSEMSQMTLINDAFIAVRGALIEAVGCGNFSKYQGPATVLHDCQNAIAVPGFIDSHTHLVHGGSREAEFAMKVQGIPYLDILKSGGGILSTVEKTRLADFETLYAQAKRSLDEMLLFGVTTIEAKSGYGLNLETEIKQLKVAKALNEQHPIDIVSTYMGAHAIPKEYLSDRNAYVEMIIDHLDKIAQLHLAEAVDVFCESDVFSLEETRGILSKAKELGFEVRMHADEIHPIGGTGLAVELGALSADHLMAIDDLDILKIGESNTVANLLPATSFYLGKPYANARKLLNANAAIALSSDYNPGSAPSENFQLTMQIAANKMVLTPFEVLNAVTINPANILRRNTMIGSLEIGKQADITLLKAPNLEYVLYHFGINHTQDVFKKGRLVVSNRRILEENI